MNGSVSYADLASDPAIKHLMRGLTPLQEERIRALPRDVPYEYREFLQQCGSGELGDASFAVYSGPITPEDYFGSPIPALEGVVLIGDDFAGNPVGFRTRDWSVVDIFHETMEVALVAESFEAFIRAKLADLTD